MDVTVHFINLISNLIKYYMKVKHLFESHTGKLLETVIYDTLEHYGKPLEALTINILFNHLYTHKEYLFDMKK